MSISTLSSIAKRGSMIVAAAVVLAATVIPSLAFADELNPLTERSLLLSSSAPGFTDTDGGGNSYAAPNSIGENYAPAGSGPNGMKSGETFSFKVSSTKTIKAYTLQYCTSAAGKCQAPGNNTGDARDSLPTPRETNATAHPLGRSDFDTVGTFTQGTGAGQFQVYVNGTASTQTWTMTGANLEDTTHSGNLTGKNNYLTLKSTTGDALNNGDLVKIDFNASESIYITNPGTGAFFVKMNTYDSDTNGDLVPGGAHNVDGGVTVANVMTDSIHITTKVLETMSFSVGTQNPDTTNIPSHGICDPISVVNGNRLNLGNPDAEYSLETSRAWDVFSYWRLSSNSSGGATVYYSGNTLANTVGDEIKSIGTTVGTPNGGKDYSHFGTEQFGLALVDAGADAMGTGTFDPDHITPNIDPLNIESNYADGTGTISDATSSNNAQFAFNKTSNTIPVLIAENNDTVIRCATAKVRYVANIAADTPAGVYTTKINYLAAPQY